MSQNKKSLKIRNESYVEITTKPRTLQNCPLLKLNNCTKACIKNPSPIWYYVNEITNS